MRFEELHEAIRKKLLHELQRIDELIESFAPLLGATGVREPDLVELSALATESRPAIAAGPLRDKPTDYLSFRHFFRNSYAYRLDWYQLRPLVRSMKETWTELKKSLQTVTDPGQLETEDPA